LAVSLHSDGIALTRRRVIIIAVPHARAPHPDHA
jgi:hypothetical protein